MKNKAFILDFNLLEENGISAEEFLLLIELLSEKDEDHSPCYYNHNLLEEKGFIKKTPEYNYELREKGKLLLELTEIDSITSITNKKFIKKSSRAINLELDDFIKEFRMLWKGLKPGSMGSEKACRDKMYNWMQDNPSYKKEDILKSAKLYIKSLDNLNYLQQADYFIYKKDIHGESSRLSAFIDEIDNKQIDDWTSRLT